MSINTIASSLAYLIPIALRLTVARNTFQRGPFHLGPFSDVINTISCLWIILTSALFVCPSEAPVTADNMNYASPVLVFVLVASLGYYGVRARKWFHGPGKSMEPDPFLDDDYDPAKAEAAGHFGKHSPVSSGDEDTKQQVQTQQIEHAEER